MSTHVHYCIQVKHASHLASPEDHTAHIGHGLVAASKPSQLPRSSSCSVLISRSKKIAECSKNKCQFTDFCRSSKTITGKLMRKLNNNIHNFHTCRWLCMSCCMSEATLLSPRFSLKYWVQMETSAWVVVCCYCGSALWLDMACAHACASLTTSTHQRTPFVLPHCKSL